MLSRDISKLSALISKCLLGPCIGELAVELGSEWPLVVLLLLSRVLLFVTPCGPQHARLLTSTVSWNLLRPMSTESVIPSNRLTLCRPLLLLPSIFPSIRVFSSESALCIRWPQFWNFIFSISPFNEYLGLISFARLT